MKKNNRREIKEGCGKKSSLKNQSILFFVYALLFVMLLIGVDFLLKLLINARKPNFLIFNLIGIEYTTNTGVAFGIFKNSPFFNTILIVLVLIIFVFSFWKISFGNTKKTSWVINRVGLIGFILILSGGLGNLVDRIFYGYVIDFIRVGGWPNFNLADSYITIGVILIIISLFSKDYHIQKE